MRRACDFTRNIPQITIDEKLLLFLQETESYLSQYLDWLPKRSGEKPLLGDLENRLTELEAAQGKPQVHDSEAKEEEKRGLWKSIKSLLGFRKKSHSDLPRSKPLGHLSASFEPLQTFKVF
ncbi:MAG: hypothetical protein ACXACI_11965 [Candidatus Hodarchaeales archaeon]|jgi:hypothetical protein